MTRPAYPQPLNAAVSLRMKRNTKRDTSPETRLRSALHATGLRFRKNLAVRTTNGLVRPDVVFTRLKVAVFVDGCFWHVCPRHGIMPRRNADYWEPKLTGNVRRDRQTTAWLTAEGWTVLRIWEHVPIDDAVRIVCDQVRAAGESARASRPVRPPRRERT